jgi:hypothetical protein
MSSAPPIFPATKGNLSESAVTTVLISATGRGGVDLAQKPTSRLLPRRKLLEKIRKVFLIWFFIFWL